MSVKSTITLTRKEAEQKYINLMLDKIEKTILPELKTMDKDDLENDLEIMNDEANDGEGFENYIVKED